MALALSSTIALVKLDYVALGNLTTASVSLPANSLVVVVAGNYTAIDDYSYAGTPTNTGTALTWTYVSGALTDDGSSFCSLAFWYAKNTSAQTVTITSNFNGAGMFPVFSFLGGYVFTGHNTTTPSGAIGGGNTSTITTTGAGSYVVSGIADVGSATYTSSNMTYQAIANSSGDSFTAYASRPTAGSFTASYANGPFNVPAYEIIEILAAGGTAHTADAAGSATATGTAAMSNARTLQAAATGTATGTAAASNQRTLAASASVTASGTASMSSTQAMSASGSVIASGTSAMASTQAMSASGSVTASGTAAADVTSLVTVDASGTITAVGTAGSTVTPQVTFQGNGTVVADGSAAVAKTMQLEATATATAISDAGMTHTFYVFKPPTREISPVSLDPYFQLVGYNLGKTLVRRDGVWSLVQNKKQEYLDQSEYAFPGGRENRINATEKAALESAGYTVETRTS